MVILNEARIQRRGVVMVKREDFSMLMMRRGLSGRVVHGVGGLLMLLAVGAQAGSLNAPAPPTDAGSAMYTVTDLYNRLLDGTSGTLRSGAFQEPTAGPTAGTGYTLNQIMGLMPALDDTDGATVAEVLTGKKFWGLRTGQWGVQTGTATLATGTATAAQVLDGATFSNSSGAQTGTMPNIGAQNMTPGTTAQTISPGYHDGTGQVAGDANLVTGNIRSGVTVFGVAGDSNVVNTSTGDAVTSDLYAGKKAWVDGSEITGVRPPAPVSKTGQTACWDEVGNSIPCTNTGQDGELQKGVSLSTPRFTDNGNGTVTDHLTGLVWLKKANCIGTDNQSFDNDGTAGDGAVTWQHALDFVKGMNAGTYGCGDTSNGGSHQTDWRLPNRRELFSLIHHAYSVPSFSNAAGTGQGADNDPFTGSIGGIMVYWSSTTYVPTPIYAWAVHLDYGGADAFVKTSTNLPVWPVRGGL